MGVCEGRPGMARPRMEDVLLAVALVGVAATAGCFVLLLLALVAGG